MTYQKKNIQPLTNHKIMRAQLIYNTSYAPSNKVVILSSYTPNN